jgi:hypothetical protein
MAATSKQRLQSGDVVCPEQCKICNFNWDLTSLVCAVCNTMCHARCRKCGEGFMTLSSDIDYVCLQCANKRPLGEAVVLRRPPGKALICEETRSEGSNGKAYI